jgi:hypothetical protein
MSLTEATREGVPQQRCPWCHESTDPSGEGWATCPRDRTPVHVICAREFGTCPICREALEPGGTSAQPAFPEVVSARAIAKGVFVRPRIGGKRFGIEPLPGSVETQLAAIARDYRRHPVLWLKVASLVVATTLLLGLGILVLFSAVPVVAPFFFLPAIGCVLLAVIARGPREPAPPSARHFRGVDLEHAGVRALVEKIAAADRASLGHARTHRAAVAEAEAAEAALAPLERPPSALFQEALEARVPIETVGTLPGIGPGTIQLLKHQGIETLRDLAARGAKGIARLGAARAEILEEWTQREQQRIAALVAHEDFPRDEMVRSLRAEAERLEDAGWAAAARAYFARVELVRLAEDRLAARAALDATTIAR